MGRFNAARMDQEIDDAERRSRNAGALGMDSDHKPLEDDDELAAAYPCRQCGTENEIAPPPGFKFTKLRGEGEDAEDRGMLEFTCEACGAENRVAAPKGYRLMVAEAAGRRRARHVAGEGADAVMSGSCECCGRENRIRPPEGHALVAAEGEGARRARVGEAVRRDSRPLSTREIDKILADAFEDPVLMGVRHAAERSEPLVDAVWNAHNRPVREGRRPDPMGSKIVDKYFPESTR